MGVNRRISGYNPSFKEKRRGQRTPEGEGPPSPISSLKVKFFTFSSYVDE